MRGLQSVVMLLAVAAGVAFALLGPNVTGQAVGTDPNNPNAPDRYEVTITLHPGDPRIHDFHLYWANVPGKPSVNKWSGPTGTWNVNASDNVVPPSGTPGVTGNVDSVSFTSTAGAQATTAPITLTFTFKPFGPNQPPPRTVYWYATSDGSSGLPGGIGDDDVEGWGMVNQLGDWNFPTW